MGLFSVSFVANFFSSIRPGKNDFAAAFRLAAYSFTPFYWLAGILNPGSGPRPACRGLAGFYSIYLFFLGATPVMGVPENQAPTTPLPLSGR